MENIWRFGRMGKRMLPKACLCWQTVDRCRPIRAEIGPCLPPPGRMRPECCRQRQEFGNIPLPMRPKSTGNHAWQQRSSMFATIPQLACGGLCGAGGNLAGICWAARCAPGAHLLGSVAVPGLDRLRPPRGFRKLAQACFRKCSDSTKPTPRESSADRHNAVKVCGNTRMARPTGTRKPEAVPEPGGKSDSLCAQHARGRARRVGTSFDG